MICAACGSETTADPCEACGQAALLEGRFRLERVIGRGAAGTTYRAVDGRDGATVAVKELPLRPGTSPKAVEMVHREAQVLQQLEHAQIPRYLTHAVTGSGKARSLYLAQGFVDGEDLAAELAHHRFTEREVLELLRDLLPVLEYLHGLSPPVVHRDVKPRNVVRRRTDGRLFLVDFGAVRDAITDPDLGGSTVAGTFGYMAPEQFGGDAGPASDLYALGALAVALLTRREPHTMLDARNRMDWAGHAGVSDGARALLDWLVEPDLTRRARSATEVREAIEAFLAGEPVRPPPDPPGPPDDLTGPPTARDADLPAPVPLEVNPLTKLIFGGPLSLETVRYADVEVDPDCYGLLADRIETALGIAGSSGVLGRSLRWTSVDRNRFVEVRVTPEGGRTRVHVRERFGNLAGGLFGGIGGGVGGGLGGGLGWLVAMELGFVAMLGFLGLVVGGSWMLAWLIFATVTGSHRRQIEALIPDLIAEVERSAGGELRREAVVKPVERPVGRAVQREPQR